MTSEKILATLGKSQTPTGKAESDMANKIVTVIAEAAQVIKRVLLENEEKQYGLSPYLIGDLTKNYSACRGVIHAQQKAAKDKADELIGLLSKTEGLDPQGELDFDGENADDVPGQMTLSEGQGPEVEQVEQRGQFALLNTDPQYVREVILRHVADGAGRSEVLELCTSKLGLSKFEVETHWDDIVRDKLIKKASGGKHVLTDAGRQLIVAPIQEAAKVLFEAAADAIEKYVGEKPGSETPQEAN